MKRFIPAIKIVAIALAFAEAIINGIPTEDIPWWVHIFSLIVTIIVLRIWVDGAEKIHGRSICPFSELSFQFLKRPRPIVQIGSLMCFVGGFGGVLKGILESENISSSLLVVSIGAGGLLALSKKR